MRRFKDSTGKLSFNYTQEERYLLSKLLNMEEYSYIEELKYSVKGCTLAPFQTSLVAFGLINKKCIISSDTGTGKTLMASGIMNCINEKQINMKWLFICPSSAKTQIEDDLNKFLYDAKVVSTNNQEDSIYDTLSLTKDDWDVLICSYEAISNIQLQKYLLSYRDVIKGIIVDESHLLCNLEGQTSIMIDSMFRQMNYALLFTATPIRVNVGQFIKQLYMVSPEIFRGKEIREAVRRYTVYDDNSRPVGVKRLEELKELSTCSYISRTRTQLGIKGKYLSEPIIAPYMEKYAEVTRAEIHKEIKGDMSGTAIIALYQLLKRLLDDGKRGLIFINLNKNKKNVKAFLEERNIKCAIRDGDNTRTDKQKEEAKRKFVDGEVDVMITNLTYNLNLPCDFVIFYELTFDFKQMIGRGERGLKPKDLLLYFIITDNTPEIQYFYENVYLRGQLLGLVCDKDVSELEVAYNKLIKRGDTTNGNTISEEKEDYKEEWFNSEIW